MGKDLESDIKEGSFHRFYLICGEEDSLRRFNRDKLKNAVIGDNEMNYTSFTKDNFDMVSFLNSATVAPFFADYRLIVLEDTGFFKSANDLRDELEGIPESTVICFVDANVDKRNKLYTFIKKNGIIKTCDAADSDMQMRYLAQLLNKNGKKMKNNTAKYFLSQIETSLYNIQNETDKLIAYSGDREEITVEDIDMVTSKLITSHIFNMMDEIASGNKDKALYMYKELIMLRENNMLILYQLIRHFNILINVLSASGNLSNKEIASVVKIPPFFVKKYLTQAKRFNEGELKNILNQCLDMEYEFKSGIIGDRIGLEMLIFNIIKICENQKIINNK